MLSKVSTKAMTLGDIVMTIASSNLLTPFLLLSWLFVLLAPRKMYPWLVAIFVPAWCAIWWLISRPVPSDDDWAWLGRAFVELSLIATFMAAGIRHLSAAFAQRRKGHAEKLNWAPARTSIFATIVGTVVLKLGPVLAHLMGAPATVILLAAVLLASCLIAAISSIGKTHRQRARTVAFMLSISTLLIAIWPYKVAESARNFAGQRPYCILVADGGVSERLATSRWDLSPLIMRANESHAVGVNRHAYIVFSEGRSAHWSYMRGAFVNDPSPFHATDQLDPDTRCKPVANFVERLSWL